MEMSPLLPIIQEEIDGLSPDRMDTSFDDLAVDSFALVALRARIEQFIGRQVHDDVWTALRTPSDLLALAQPASATLTSTSRTSTARSYEIGMPQMAMSGLSESWLFKELGDLHWQMVTTGLGAKSSELQDGQGNRLYATFTRILMKTPPLSSYRENAQLAFDGTMSRVGAGIFISEIAFGPGQATMMSSFSSRSGSNTNLLRGQPEIPENCGIPALATSPAFLDAYREQRSASYPDSIFSSEYELIPQYDINGVGLLYFASYPMITDICEARAPGHERGLSVTGRDVYYFNNCDPTDTIIYDLRSRDSHGGYAVSEATLARKSDGKTIAFVRTQRAAA